MPNRVKRLEAIIHQHHLAVSPPLVVKKPPPKSTKLQNNKSVVCLLVFVHWCTCVSVCTLRTPLLQNRIMSFIMITVIAISGMNFPVASLPILWLIIVFPLVPQ